MRLSAARSAALAASGTVSLELALAGVPMVAAYKVGALEIRILRALVTAPFVLLPNLILGEGAVPEFIQEDCTAHALAAALSRRSSTTRPSAARSSPRFRACASASPCKARTRRRAPRVVVGELRLKSRHAGRAGSFDRAKRRSDQARIDRDVTDLGTVTG